METIKKYISLIKSFWAHLHTEKGLSQLALFPLFFCWYPVVFSKYENEYIRKNCLVSFLLTLIFFGFVAMGSLLTLLPTIGSILANLSHLIGILLYLASSGFLIYSLQKEKMMVLPFLRKLLFLLENFLIEKERP
jgi:uncharacterized membrane protein